jgi:hypothetical protein
MLSMKTRLENAWMHFRLYYSWNDSVRRIVLCQLPGWQSLHRVQTGTKSVIPMGSHLSSGFRRQEKAKFGKTGREKQKTGISKSLDASGGRIG